MKKTIKFIDLFAGLGGIRLGFEQAFKELGFETECVLTSEIKPAAITALNKNFSHKKFVGDICNVKANEIEDFDFLLAGFPCQPFSFAGNRLGFADTRGTLFFEVERILKEKRPYGFLLENVEGLITHDLVNKNDNIGRTFKTILEHLSDLGYKVEWRLLDSKDFGVAQSRKRVYITGTLNTPANMHNFNVSHAVLEDILEKNLPVIHSDFTNKLLSFYSPNELYGKSIKDKRGGKDNIHSWDIELKGKITKDQKNLLSLILTERRKKKWAEEIGIKWMDGMPLTYSQIETFYSNDNLKDMLEDLVSKGYLKKEYPKQEVLSIDNKGNKTYKRVPDKNKEIGYNIVAGKLSFEFNKILDPTKIAPTLVATDISKLGIIDNNGIRTLSLREGLRLFGYPESYSLSDFDSPDKKRLGFDLLGNTVVINVIREVSKRLAKSYILDTNNGTEIPKKDLKPIKYNINKYDMHGKIKIYSQISMFE